MTLSIYIWEGNGISDAYHDDGTLVVLAESPEQARELVRAERTKVTYFAANRYYDATKYDATDERFPSDVWDGTEEALDREPDRVVPVDKPAWVAFNGGGYD